MIENYLGFPQGISGSELATRATAQAKRFGAEVLLARRLVGHHQGRPGLCRPSFGRCCRAVTGHAPGQRCRLASSRGSGHRRTPGFRCVLRGRPERGGHLQRVPSGHCRGRELGRSGGHPLLAVRRAGDLAGPGSLARGIDVPVPDQPGEGTWKRRGSDEHRSGRSRIRCSPASTDGFVRRVDHTHCPPTPCSCASEGCRAPRARPTVGLASTAPDTCALGPNSSHRPAHWTDGRCLASPCLSKRTCPGCSPPATSGVGRSSAVRPPSARDPWRSRWSTSASLKSAVNDVGTSPTTDPSGDPAVAGPSREAEAEFSRDGLEGADPRGGRRPRTQRNHLHGGRLRRRGERVPFGRSSRWEPRSTTTPPARSKSSASPRTSSDRGSISRFVPVSTRWIAKCRVVRCGSCRLRPIGSSGASTPLTEEGHFSLRPPAGASSVRSRPEPVTWYWSSVRRRSFPISARDCDASTSIAFLLRIGGPGRPTAFPAESTTSSSSTRRSPPAGSPSILVNEPLGF